MRGAEGVRLLVPSRRLKDLGTRLWRAQLRFRVMAGVVAVTLAALAAFDVTAVTTMRSYLLSQTDQDLRAALILTSARLPLLIPGYVPGRTVEPARQAPGQAQEKVPVKRASNLPASVVSALGQFGIDFVPVKGKQVALQVGANGPGGGALVVPRSAMRAAADAGPVTVAVPGEKSWVRLDHLPVNGGALVDADSLYQVDAVMGRVETIVALGSVGVVLLIGAGVFLVLRRGLRPVETMAAEADRITAGDLRRRVTSRAPRSELGRLATALNGMLTRIESSVRDQEAVQEQTRRFFADASHELRTPIASLRANAELYQQGALTDPAQVDEVMRRIALETVRMGRLVDDMLRLARLGRQPGRSREPLDLTALIGDCAERARAADPSRNWEVRVGDGLTVTGDAELLRRAVDNLLVNVLVHTPPSATAELTAFVEPENRVVIEVTDDGPGVPADRLPHIFERFYRAGPGADGVPGSGLGLAIVAEVAAAHGGTATAAPRSPHGLRIVLKLPVLAQAETAGGANPGHALPA